MAIGKPVIRTDGAAKATGRAKFTDDYSMFGMKTAKYLRSTIPHGRVIRIDVSKAQALPGVLGVYTFEDVPRIPFATAGHPYSMDPSHSDAADRLILTDYVRYLGDEIAVVVADDEITADRALSLIEVEYEKFTPLIKPEDVLAKGAVEIHAGTKNVVGEHVLKAGGRIEEAEATCATIVEGFYETQVVQHCHLENHTAYAYMDDLDRITIVSSTQIPHTVRRIVSEALDLPLGRIRVIKPFLGGGFGNKQDVVLEPIVAWLTMKLDGIPIKLVLSREEGMVGTRVRHPIQVKARAGVDKDGLLKFFDMDVLSNTGAYASHGHSIASAGAAKTHYLYPRATYECRAKTIYSNLPSGGAMRGYGSPQMIFAVECLMEELVRSLNMDSVDFRLKNVVQPGDMNQLSGKPIRSSGLAECLKKGRELIGWDKKRARKGDGPVRRGLGVACFSYASGTYPVCVESAGARMILNQDGSVHVSVGATEIGQGSDTALAQMAAESLGASFDSIHIISIQDTDTTPFDTGAYASRQTYVSGQAVKQAALKLKKAILEYAGRIKGQAPENLDVVGTRVVFARRPEIEVVSLKDLALDAYYHKDRGGQITAEASYKTRTNAPSYGCTFVDLEVDVPMCQVRINEIYNIHDAGVIINPVLAEGQVHGGMAMSVGAALFEELMIDSETGWIYNPNMLDYKVPTIMDMPRLGADFVETIEPTSSFGQKSLGEPPVLSPAPAIRNAIYDAVGVKINSLPMGPKQLFKHFRRAGLV